MVSPPWPGKVVHVRGGQRHLLLGAAEDAARTRREPGVDHESRPRGGVDPEGRPSPARTRRRPRGRRRTVAAACHTMCQRGISAVYQPAKKLGTTRSWCRAGRKAFTTSRAPTRLTARYTHAHAMAPSSLMVGRWRTPADGRAQGSSGGHAPTQRGRDDHGTTDRARRDVPVSGDTQPPHARLDGGHVRPVHRPGRLFVRQAARPGELPPGAGPDLPPATGRGSLPSEPSLLGRRPDVRHRVPHPPGRGARPRAASRSWPNSSATCAAANSTAASPCGRCTSSKGCAATRSGW